MWHCPADADQAPSILRGIVLLQESQDRVEDLLRSVSQSVGVIAERQAAGSIEPTPLNMGRVLKRPVQGDEETPLVGRSADLCQFSDHCDAARRTRAGSGASRVAASMRSVWEGTPTSMPVQSFLEASRTSERGLFGMTRQASAPRLQKPELGLKLERSRTREVSQYGAGGIVHAAPSGESSMTPDITKNYTMQSGARNITSRISTISDSDGSKVEIGMDLPEGWPANIEPSSLLSLSIEDADRMDIGRKMTRFGAGSSSVSMTLQESQKSFTHVQEVMLFAKGVRAINPESRGLIYFDIFALMLMLYDFVSITWIVSFNTVPLDMWLDIASHFSMFFWIFWVYFNFLRGYNKRGDIILEQPRAARHYLKTRFALDFTLVVLDIMAHCLSPYFEGDKGTLMQRFVRFLRFLKCFRVIRLFSLLDSAAKLIEHLPRNMHVLFMIVQVTKITFMTLLSNHVFGCLFYLAGREGASDTETRWLDLPVSEFDTLGVDGSPRVYYNSTQHYLYLTALQWSVGQMTLGGSDITPLNSLERALNISGLFMGLFVGSTIVSLFSAQVVNMMLSKQEELRLLDTLGKYIQQNQISQSLKVRVLGQVHKRLKDEEQLREEDVQALDLISSALREEIITEVRAPHILTHALFQMWKEVDSKSITALCLEAVDFVFLVPHDPLFTAGVSCHQAYYLVQGELLYTQVPRKSWVAADTFTVVTEGTWFCEAALWSEWLHVGDMQAVYLSRVLAVRARGLEQVICKDSHQAVRFITATYGKNYHVRIASSIPPHAAYPTDLTVAFTDASDLMSNQVGLALVKRFKQSNSSLFDREAVKKLEKELREEKCAVQQDSSGQLERIVMVAAVRIERDDGRNLYQLAKWDKGFVDRVACQLPGTKRGRGELPQVAYHRIVSEDLRVLSGYIKITRTEHQTDKSTSPAYGMPTTYMRTVYVAHLEGKTHEEVLPVAGVFSHPSVPSLEERDVFKLCIGGEKWLFLAFLDESEVALLKLDEAKEALKLWLNTLDPTSSLL